MRISDWSSDVCSSDLRDCPSHGILGADNNSGSFTLEYSEIFNSDDGTRRHSIYMQPDEVAYPGSVFRMQYNYVPSPTGGVLVRGRHERAEIYYNWSAGDSSNRHGAVEPSGARCEPHNPGWADPTQRGDHTASRRVAPG